VDEIGSNHPESATAFRVNRLSQQPPEDTADDAVLRLASIEKGFTIRGKGWRESHSLRALGGVDLELRQSECVALVGESGCGKSTLLRVIAGLLQPDRGRVDLRVAGTPQMVFQDAGASLTPWLTVGEQISERVVAAGVPRSERKAVINLALQRVGLQAGVAKSKPGQLSGGQRQRIALARAIVIPPPVLLCDEPTSSLDMSLAATVLNLVDELRSELGMAVLFVTHDIAAARYISDRIAVMYLGRIVEIGDSHRVATAPAHPYTKALLTAVTTLERRLTLATSDLPSPLAPPSGCPFHPRCPEAIDRCSVEEQPLRPVPGDSEREAACIHVGVPS
jgi:peptide/nickel transport system ATP-binding protein